MLEFKEIKKGCELADEFESHVGLNMENFLEYKKSINDRWAFSSDYHLSLYELFLQKVIEGLNKKARQSPQKFTVITNHYYIIVYDWEKKCNALSLDLKDVSNAEANEQAIKYIFTEMSIEKR